MARKALLWCWDCDVAGEDDRCWVCWKPIDKTHQRPSRAKLTSKDPLPTKYSSGNMP